MRTKRITINGTEYWITYSVRCQIAMDAYYKENGREEGTVQSMTSLFRLLCAELDAGYRWAKKNGETPLNPPPDPETLMDEISTVELAALAPDLSEIVLGERHVVAKPPKKAAAGDSGEQPAK